MFLAHGIFFPEISIAQRRRTVSDHSRSMTIEVAGAQVRCTSGLCLHRAHPAVMGLFRSALSVGSSLTKTERQIRRIFFY